MFFLLLSSLFPSLGEGSCLRCWSDLLPLVQYDLEVLWGSRQPPLYLSTCLRVLLFKKNVPVNPQFLDRAHLEEEAAIFFSHLDVAIKEWRSDKIRLLNKIQIHGKGFLQGLQKAARELKDKVCSESCITGPSTEVANCINCKKYYLTCKDPVLCNEALLPRTIWIGSTIILILCVFVSTFGSVLYYFWWRPLQLAKDSVWWRPLQFWKDSVWWRPLQLGKDSVELNKPEPEPGLAPTQSPSPPPPPPPPPPLLPPPKTVSEQPLAPVPVKSMEVIIPVKELYFESPHLSGSLNEMTNKRE
ncbi:testis-expressed protein 51 isoform X2 [Notamacropus eugenii]|uniref:testis-expressed protein 51 isoform X2 n=1 Tax=Notamacropus eugenii TaxID=9315 RepID=UPI003B676970